MSRRIRDFSLPTPAMTKRLRRFVTASLPARASSLSRANRERKNDSAEKAAGQPGSQRSYGLDFDPHLTFNEVLRLTLSDLDCRRILTGERLAMIGQFYDYLIAQLERGDIVSLLIG